VSVKVNIHPFLQHLTDNLEVVEVEGNSVGKCLETLIARYPGTGEWLLEKDGGINNLVEIYVNMESSYPDELAKPVKDGDELQIIIMITGG